MKINIDDSIASKCPEFNVYSYIFDVDITKSDKLTELIEIEINKIENNYEITDVTSIDKILDGRNAYKSFKKDPSRYKLAVESLYRRIVKGNGLYYINNVVDIGNLISILTKKSVCVVDYDKVVGNINIRLGNETDDYEGISRGKINITNIPLYEDEISPFGSTTSDTPRTMITNETKKVLILIINFKEYNDKEENTNLVNSLFSEYAKS